ncbi:MAG: hypothetical protein EOP10_08235 [Proteobacteria bacterium]|nr:MAG: hypothetical protein EOP10_08235 [Pseudomonadota bacterium]
MKFVQLVSILCFCFVGTACVEKKSSVAAAYRSENSVAEPGPSCANGSCSPHEVITPDCAGGSCSDSEDEIDCAGGDCSPSDDLEADCAGGSCKPPVDDEEKGTTCSGPGGCAPPRDEDEVNLTRGEAFLKETCAQCHVAKGAAESVVLDKKVISRLAAAYSGSKKMFHSTYTEAFITYRKDLEAALQNK